MVDSKYIALFKRCADQCRTTEMMLRGTEEYQVEYEEFQRLHREIENADLEDEYQEWKKANGYVWLQKNIGDKQKILNLLLPALQATEDLSSLIQLEYEKEKELVYAKFANGVNRIISLDTSVSGMEMIREVLEWISK